MRLLNTRTLELQSFIGVRPPYAILSHCWEEEEVLFADFLDLESARKKKGFAKVEKTCEQAARDGFDHVWIDTCCIDKSSSAELSEAINSMFAWYKGSGICYAYLADVDGPEDFDSSKWFTRAWTLQELLAPNAFKEEQKNGMVFFSRQWTKLGTKAGLSRRIAYIAGIDREFLEGKNFDSASVSMRMSWAADRQATRAEDIAYSLLGIFDVNMPLLYGEGKLKAFRRLQEEIMKISEDETLFAWESAEFEQEASANVLASDPKDFSEAKNLVPYTSDDAVAPYSLTHRGLRIWLQLFRLSELEKTTQDKIQWGIRPLRSPIMIWSGSEFVWAILKCHAAHDYGHLVGIPLQHLQADIYVRAASSSVVLIPRIFSLSSALENEKEIYIRNSRVQSITSSVQRRLGFLIRHLPKGVEVSNTSYPTEAWKPEDKILQIDGQHQDGDSWHASIMLILSMSSGSSGSQSAVRLSLGCMKTPTSKTPRPWCCLDDEPRWWGSVDLWAFHKEASSKTPRYEMVSGKAIHSQQQYPRLRVVIQADKVLGQRMFIVDVEQAQSNEGLAVPEKTNQENPSSSDVEDTAPTSQPIIRPDDSRKSVRWDELEVRDPKAELRESMSAPTVAT